MNGPDRFEAYDGHEGEGDHAENDTTRGGSGVQDAGASGAPGGPQGPDGPRRGDGRGPDRPPRIPMPRASVEDSGLPLPAPAD
ncbi:hypothetical protein ABZZ16_15770, partial [Streptomyces sp. NPDC006386]